MGFPITTTDAAHGDRAPAVIPWPARAEGIAASLPRRAGPRREDRP